MKTKMKKVFNVVVAILVVGAVSIVSGCVTVTPLTQEVTTE